jgi:hypothetical protein
MRSMLFWGSFRGRLSASAYHPGSRFVLRQKLLVLKLQTVECSALAFGNNLSTGCRLLPHRFVHVPLSSCCLTVEQGKE